MLKLKEYLDWVWSQYSPMIMRFSGPFRENVFNLFTELHHNYEFWKNPDRFGNNNSESLDRIVGGLKKGSAVFDGWCGNGWYAICIAK